MKDQTDAANGLITLKERPIFIDSIPTYMEFLEENKLDNTPWRYQVYSLARQPLHKENYDLSEKIKELEAELKDLKENHFVGDYQIFVKDLLCKNGLLITFQGLRKLAYSHRLKEGHTPQWGNDSYRVELETLDFEKLPGGYSRNPKRDELEAKVKDLEEFIKEHDMDESLKEWNSCN